MSGAWTELRATRWSDAQAAEYYRAGLWTEDDFAGLLRRRAAEHPGRPACTDGRQGLTYAELDERVRRASAGLGEHGLRPDDVVLLRASNTTAHVTAFFALAAAGAVVYETPTDASPAQVAEAIGRVHASAIVSDSAAHLEDPAVARSATLRVALVEEANAAGAVAWGDLLGAPAAEPAPRDPDRVSMLTPTSGTTGTPKIAMRTANCSLAMARMLVRQSKVEAGDTFLVAAPLYGGTGAINAFGVPALTGCTLVVAPDLKPDPLLDLIERYRVTRIATLPTLATRMLASERFAASDTSTVESLQTGGAALKAEVAKDIEAAFGCRVAVIYGSIDVGCPSSVSIEETDLVHRGLVGRPTLGSEVRIIDPEGNPLGPGEVGEIAMRGPDTAVGYFEDPEATARAFDADGWGHLGDLGSIDADGNLRVSGRLKEIINRGGKKISIAEVENAVAAFPPVLDVAAVGYPDEDLGERCAVFVVTRPEEPVALAGLREHLERRGVPKYMWPERVENVGALPVAGSGKVRREQLREWLATAPPG